MALRELATAVQAHPLLTVVILGVVAAVAWVVRARHKASLEADLPFLRFEDGDDSRQRYATDSGTLFKIGYDRYLRHGQAFKMRNYIGELSPQVYLPLKYLDEVKTAPQSKLSVPYYSVLHFSQNWTGMAQQTDEATHVIRTDLVRNQPLLYPGLEAERAAVIDEKLPRTKEWQSVGPYPIFAYVMARLAAKTTGAAELARNDEWLGIMIGVTQKSMAAAHALRESWPWWSRWLARYVFPPVKEVFADRKRAAEILRPILEERVAALHAPAHEKIEKPNDGIQWLIEYYHARGYGARLTPEVLAQDQLFFAIASIHSSTAILLSILYDLIDERNAQSKAEVIDEIETVQKEFGTWSRQAVSKLVKLDSFMKESGRLNYVAHARVSRVAMIPYTFKDGLHIPRGTMIQLLHSGIQHDGEFFENPQTFDPWRFLKKRKEGDPNKFQFASLSNVETQFGAGFHACPARNYATDVIKLILVYLLTKYDIKYDGDSQRRPQDFAHDNATLPNLATQLLYRERSVPVS
ncbi:cytochrome P450 [Immersiella caudata]|uniref:Cytochrome P450 n=1 Tax=Immersiella caudata TaxID=314043 RepID=A0AA39WVU5_9PEZI|nr:cytochrome P450 [Immersiella caudata]